MKKNKAAQALAHLRHSKLTPQQRSENAAHAGRGNRKRKREN